MKRCIITPTYGPHFKYIKKYLKSFDMYVEDKDFPIYFIINLAEKEEFEKIISDYPSLNINILYFDDLLKAYNIPYKAHILLYKYDKYCYQTMKKIYAMLYLNMDQYLMVDSESMWIKKTNMNKLFDDYFSAPHFGYSKFSTRKIKKTFQQILLDNINYILKEDNDKWFLETFSWFIDKKYYKKSYGNMVILFKCQTACWRFAIMIKKT